MWLSNLFRFSSLFSLIFLYGCGFQPLYSPQLKTTQDLSHIKIQVIADRDGQNLRNHLLDLLNPYGVPCQSEYTLDTKFTAISAEVGIRRDATISRRELIATVTITLRDSTTGKDLFTKTITSKNTYTTMDTNYYTNVVTEDYSKEEAIRDLAYKIQLVLSEYFANQAP